MLVEYIKNKIDAFLSSLYDEESKAVIRQLTADGKEKELYDAFYKDLEFGTGGLRGIMGVGTNRMNKYTVGKATQGFANRLKQSFPNEEVKVAVAYDSRNNSRAFADITADVFSANGIKVFLFDDLRPTPLLSFAVRQLDCHGGVVITASHNPKEYNGYKAYWQDGAQVTHPHDEAIIEEVNRIDVRDIKFDRIDENVTIIGNEMDDIYLSKLKELSFFPEIIEKHRNLKIVYTPIHGAGIQCVPQALKAFGFENITIVAKQAQPDGDFPTVTYPNPEEPEALQLALKKAEEIDADLVLATDPDADRVAACVRDGSGKMIPLNGNQTASLLTYYLIKASKEKNRLAGNEFVVSTIVTTELIREIAESNQIEYYETLTGFKHIAAKIREFEGEKTFIGGGEESYGYMIGDFVRDKDGVAACAVFAALTAFAVERFGSVFNMLLQMYTEYGFYKEKLVSVTKKGSEGAEEIEKMMEEFRTNPPKILAGSRVMVIKDIYSGVEKNISENNKKTINLPKSNVLQFITEDGSKVSLRPSGTEPKIKFYFSVNGKMNAAEDYKVSNAAAEEKINSLIQNLNLNG